MDDGYKDDEMYRIKCHDGVLRELQHIHYLISKLQTSLQQDKIETITAVERIRADLKLLDFKSTALGSLAGLIASAVVTYVISKF